MPCRDVSEKRKARKGDSGLTGPVDIPEVLLEKLGFPRKIQFQKVGGLHVLLCAFILVCLPLTPHRATVLTLPPSAQLPMPLVFAPPPSFSLRLSTSLQQTACIPTQVTR